MSRGAPEGLTSIATHVQDCLNSFNDVCTSLLKADSRIRNKIPPGTIHDCLGRYRLWVGNIGAHRRGRGSLDYKLREASHIRDRVIELLQNLKTVLGEALQIITEERVPWEDLSDSDSDESEDESAHPNEDPTTELAQLASNMAEISSCLMRLSLAIRNPAPHDQFKESSQINVTHFETFDVDHVRGKFPNASEYLVQRLGKAISRRRQYLRYREEHRKKLEQGLKPQPVVQEVITISLPNHTVMAPSEKIESTVASSIPLAIKASTSIANLDEEDLYEDTLSQTSYASSNSDPSRLRPPPLPVEGHDGDPFECPLCFRFTSVRQTNAWNKHVYRDLQPYVCTFDECKIPDRTYESRHDWFQHELQTHRKWWKCVDGCNQTFHSADHFRRHLSDHHTELVHERSSELLRNCERQQSMDSHSQCPLCLLELPSLVQLRRHLGKHHEELALFALPSHMKDDDEEVDDDRSGANSRSDSSVAGSNESNAQSDVACDLCTEMFQGHPIDGREELIAQLHKVHKQRSTYISALDKGHPDMVKAENLLAVDMSARDALDDHPFNRSLLVAHVVQLLPANVITWADLKLHLENAIRANSVLRWEMRVLQAVQYGATLNDKKFAEYLGRLGKAHEENLPPQFPSGDMTFEVGDQSVSGFTVLKALNTLGSLRIHHEETFNWQDVGYALPHRAKLSADAAASVRSIYNRYNAPLNPEDATVEPFWLPNDELRARSPPVDDVEDSRNPPPPSMSDEREYLQVEDENQEDMQSTIGSQYVVLLPDHDSSFAVLSVSANVLTIENYEKRLNLRRNWTTKSRDIQECALSSDNIITCYGLKNTRTNETEDLRIVAANALDTEKLRALILHYMKTRRVSDVVDTQQDQKQTSASVEETFLQSHASDDDPSSWRHVQARPVNLTREQVEEDLILSQHLQVQVKGLDSADSVHQAAIIFKSDEIQFDLLQNANPTQWVLKARIIEDWTVNRSWDSIVIFVNEEHDCSGSFSLKELTITPLDAEFRKHKIDRLIQGFEGLKTQHKLAKLAKHQIDTVASVTDRDMSSETPEPDDVGPAVPQVMSVPEGPHLVAALSTMRDHFQVISRHCEWFGDSVREGEPIFGRLSLRNNYMVVVNNGQLVIEFDKIHSVNRDGVKTFTVVQDVEYTKFVAESAEDTGLILHMIQQKMENWRVGGEGSAEAEDGAGEPSGAPKPADDSDTFQSPDTKFGMQSQSQPDNTVGELIGSGQATSVETDLRPPRDFDDEQGASMVEPSKEIQEYEEDEIFNFNLLRRVDTEIADSGQSKAPDAQSSQGEVNMEAKAEASSEHREETAVDHYQDVELTVPAVEILLNPVTFDLILGLKQLQFASSESTRPGYSVDYKSITSTRLHGSSIHMTADLVIDHKRFFDMTFRAADMVVRPGNRLQAPEIFLKITAMRQLDRQPVDDPVPAAETKNWVTTTIRGHEHDITDLGLDRDYIEALPEDLREEVVMQRIADKQEILRARAEVEGKYSRQDLTPSRSKDDIVGVRSEVEIQLLSSGVDNSASLDRWAQIRAKAADRAAKSRMRDQNLSQPTDNGERSGEESIESRVARIKRRVAELTGTMVPPPQDMPDPTMNGGYFDSIYDEMVAWDPNRPSDDIVEERFKTIIEKQGWDRLPEASRKVMETYNCNFKWSLVRHIEMHGFTLDEVAKANDDLAGIDRWKRAQSAETTTTAPAEPSAPMPSAKEDTYQVSHEHRSTPPGPPSPPPRTAQDQDMWDIPPPVSNWRNPKGYTVPLDERLAADGQSLEDKSGDKQGHQASDSDARLDTASITEAYARGIHAIGSDYSSSFRDKLQLELQSSLGASAAALQANLAQGEADRQASKQMALDAKKDALQDALDRSRPKLEYWVCCQCKAKNFDMARHCPRDGCGHQREECCDCRTIAVNESGKSARSPMQGTIETGQTSQGFGIDDMPETSVQDSGATGSSTSNIMDLLGESMRRTQQSTQYAMAQDERDRQASEEMTLEEKKSPLEDAPNDSRPLWDHWLCCRCSNENLSPYPRYVCRICAHDRDGCPDCHLYPLDDPDKPQAKANVLESPRLPGSDHAAALRRYDNYMDGIMTAAETSSATKQYEDEQRDDGEVGEARETTVPTSQDKLECALHDSAERFEREREASRLRAEAAPFDWICCQCQSIHYDDQPVCLCGHIQEKCPRCRIQAMSNARKAGRGA